jgi:hypothetical protein
MNTMQQTKPVSAVGAEWSTGVHCPGCGADAEPTNLLRMPKWHCPDSACDFARGWRLIPSAGRIYAMPVGEDPTADPSKIPALRNKAVPWLKAVSRIPKP